MVVTISPDCFLSSFNLASSSVTASLSEKKITKIFGDFPGPDLGVNIFPTQK